MNLTSLTPQQLRHAADLQEKIASLQDELSRYLGASTATTAPVASRKKSRMSAAGRAAIIAAQKARWAKAKAGKPAAATANKSKRKMSPAARAKIAAIARARWAKVKASGKKAL